MLPGDIRLPYGRLIAAGIAVAASRSRWSYVMRRTRTGLSILATGMDRGAARLMGIRARHVYALTFGIAAAWPARPAPRSARSARSPRPTPAGYTLFSFVVAVLGGLGNMYGALVRRAGHRAGRGVGGQYLPGTWSTRSPSLVLVLVLLGPPAGLAGPAFYASRVEV